jgi:hypothetical protein
MAGEDLLTYSGQASIAYSNALEQAKGATNALLRQYGFVAPGVNGSYSIEGAQAAFDPNTLFDKSTGGINQSALDNLTGGLQVGGRGMLADLKRAGVSGEADVVSEARSRGFGGDIGGGLMSQRRNLAETVGREQVEGARQNFIAGIGGALSPIGGAFQDLQIGKAKDKYSMDADKAARESMVAPEAETAAGVSGKPALGAGPAGDFMKKMTNISKSGNKSAQVNNLKSIKQNYSLSAQQNAYIDSFLKRLG